MTLVAAGAGGGAMPAKALEAVAGAGGTALALAGGPDVLARCCFKRKAPPNINTQKTTSAKTNLGLINATGSAGLGEKKKSKTDNARLGLNF